MRVLVPSPLRSYTHGHGEVAADGTTMAELRAALDREFAGIRFRMIDEHDRIREHIRFFVNRERVVDLGQALAPGDEVQIICAR